MCLFGNDESFISCLALGSSVTFSPDPSALRSILQNEGVRVGALGGATPRVSTCPTGRGTSIYSVSQLKEIQIPATCYCVITNDQCTMMFGLCSEPCEFISCRPSEFLLKKLKLKTPAQRLIVGLLSYRHHDLSEYRALSVSFLRCRCKQNTSEDMDTSEGCKHQITVNGESSFVNFYIHTF